MAIRLNLLAEAQAAEEMRRQDPVKRAAWIAALLIALMLVWASSLQLKGMLANNELSTVQSKMNIHTNEYQRIRDNQKKVGDIKIKLAALDRLSTNRFLNGTLLHALQQNTVDDVQLVHLRVEQTYVHTPETKPTTNASRTLPGKPAATTERIVINLEGNDSSLNPGDQVGKFREILANAPYFRQMLGKTNEVTLKQQSATQVSPDTGKPCVLFTLEGHYQEKTR